MNKLKVKKKLIPIKNEIRNLGNSKIRHLSTPQVEHGILSTIATVVLPTLISLLSKNRK